MLSKIIATHKNVCDLRNKYRIVKQSIAKRLHNHRFYDSKVLDHKVNVRYAYIAVSAMQSPHCFFFSATRFRTAGVLKSICMYSIGVHYWINVAVSNPRQRKRMGQKHRNDIHHMIMKIASFERVIVW